MKRIKRVLQIAIGVLSLGSFASAHADPIVLNLAVGNLQVGSTNNEFLSQFGINGSSGQETPQIDFYSPSSSSFPSSSGTTYAMSSNPSFTFDYSFSVLGAATISQNAVYGAFVGSATSTVSLLQGANVVATATQTGLDPYFTGFTPADYSFPTVVLSSGIRYDLVITTLGLPASYAYPGGGAQGFSQIALDVTAAPTSAPTPEPSSLILLATGLLSTAGFTWKRNKRTTSA